MLRYLKQILLFLILTVALAPGAKGFSLLGPYKSWQTGSIGYNLTGDIGGPMGLFEDYRWNIRTITYAFDQSFLLYFGTNGVNAISNAFAILGALTNVSDINPDLFPQTDMLRQNHRAAALGLLDLKSAALHHLVALLHTHHLA